MPNPTTPVVPAPPLDYATKFGALRVGKNVNQISGLVGFGLQAVEKLALAAPLAASGTYYENAVPMTAGVLQVNQAPDFVRNVQIVASGAATGVITIAGLDANGFPITEALTLNGATPVLGKKGFSFVQTITIATTVGATTLSVGIGVKFGLRTRLTENTLLLSLTDNVPDTAATVVLGSTSAGTDYYGTIQANTAPNASHNYSFYFIPTDLNAAGVNN